MSGYCDCACRDCFDIAIQDSADKPALCAECSESDCDGTGHSDCCRPDCLEPEQY